MPTHAWSGLGVAAGTTLDNTNTNAAGNGDTLVYQALSGGATRITVQESNGNGVEITGPAGSLARLDTNAIAGGEECMAVSFVYKAPAAPTTDHSYLIVARNANAAATFSGYCAHTLSNLIEFRNAANAVVSGGASPALVAGNYYKVDMAIIRNTTTTPSTSNGRIIGRVQSITAPGTWNAGAEFYIDTGYTVNVTVDKTNLFRTGKTSTAGATATMRFLNLSWRDLATPNTSTTKALAITNFVQVTGPSVSTTGTGAHYLIYAVGTPAVGGALSYSIAQTAGNPTTPVSVAPGVYRVDQDPNGPLTYTVTVTEAGGGETSSTAIVPQGGAVAGLFRRVQQVSGVLMGVEFGSESLALDDGSI